MNSHHKYINWVFGIFLSICLVWGYEAELCGEVLITKWWTHLCVVILAVVLSLLIRQLWDLLLINRKRIPVRKKLKPWIRHDFENDNKLFGKAALTIWIAHFIVFLGVFPGFFVYDAQDELMETVTRSFNNRHPLLHVLSMGGVIQTVHKITGSYNAGIAAFILLGMTLSSLLYGYIIYRLKKKSTDVRTLLILTLYYAFFPVIVMYSLCSVKDGVFALSLTLCVMYILRMSDEPDMFFASPKLSMNLVASMVIMMLLRNNGVYALICFMLLSVAMFLKKQIIRRYMLKYFLCCFFAIVAYLLINKTLLFATHAANIGHSEILSVPIQQMARVYDYDKESLSDDDIDKLSKYIPLEALSRYNPKCSDMVKIDFNDKAYTEDKLGFYDIYFKLGFEHPIAYLNAAVMTSYGMWCPGATIDGYTGNTVFTYTYGNSSYFGYETEEPGNRNSLIPVIDKLYRWFSLGESFQRIPVVSLIFSPGFVLWAALLIMGFMAYSGHSLDAFAYALPVLVVFTCFLGPVSLVRYALPLWIVLPLMIIRMRKISVDYEKDYL